MDRPPKCAVFRFHGPLNDFLPAWRKNTWINYNFNGSPAVKDAIEAIGVPHPEVDVIIINNTPSDFTYSLQHEDQVEVYPLDGTNIFPADYSISKQRQHADKFVLDVHLGKLAKALRMLGFDTRYENYFTDAKVIEIAAAEDRVVLTRDIPLLKNKAVKYGYWLRSQKWEEQLKEVITYFKLRDKFRPFQRCLVCNGILENIDKESVADKLPLQTKQYFNEFLQCTSCKKVYWKGSHYERMKEFMKQL